MTRLTLMIVLSTVSGCSLGPNLSAGYVGPDQGIDAADDGAGGTSDGGAEAGVDTEVEAGDTPDAPTDGPADVPPDPDVDDADDVDVALDVPDAPPVAMCTEVDLSECPPGPLDVVAVACENGVCVYDCGPDFRDVDGEPGCECPYTGEEICDGLDNNCDGEPDEGLDVVPCDDQDGVCNGSVAGCGDGVVDCDDAVYSAFASGRGLVYDPAEIEVYCDGEDNNCDGDTDLYCCAVGAQWSRIPALTAGHSQREPTIARRNEVGAVAWLEVATSELQDSLGVTGQLRYAYLDSWGQPTADAVTVNAGERSRVPHIVRSHKNDRFVIARAVLTESGVLLKQQEIHNGLETDAELFAAERGVAIDGVDQTFLGDGNVLVTWSTRGLCPNPGCGTVHAIVANWMEDNPRLGGVLEISDERVIAWNPQVERVGSRSVLVYQFSGPGPNGTRVQGLRWQVFDRAEPQQGATGEFLFDPAADTRRREFEVFGLGAGVGIVVPSPPNGRVRVLLIDPTSPRDVGSVSLLDPGTTTVATGFGQEGVAGLAWWSEDFRRLEFSSLSELGWVRRAPLRDFGDETGAMFGLASTPMEGWGLVVTSSTPDLARSARLEITAVGPFGGRLCPP